MGVFHPLSKKTFSRMGVLGCILLTCLCFVLGMQSASAETHRLNYFKSYETEANGRQTLRIEIGMTGDDLTYEVTAKPTLKKQLVIDMNSTKRGKVKENIPLKNDLVESMSLSNQSRNLQAILQFKDSFTEDQYEIHTEKADRRNGLPFRLIIDIFEEPAEGANILGDGVKGRTILLDPGHGGSDSGAVGYSGVTEASVTLPVAQKTRDILQRAGANVVMTRNTDVDVYGRDASARQELQARVDVGARAGADVFVSIHCNAFSSPTANGMETYYYGGSSEGERLATLLNEELAEACGLYNRGVKSANFYVMKHSAMPASLIELGFVTNPREEAKLADDAYQETLAEAIARGIERFFTGE